MSPPNRYRIVVCRGPECGDKRGSAELHRELDRLLQLRRLGEQVELDRQTCFGRCLSGPNIMVQEAARGPTSTFGAMMPGAAGDAVLYSGVRLEDLVRIVDEHVIAGRPIRALLNRQAKPVRGPVKGIARDGS